MNLDTILREALGGFMEYVSLTVDFDKHSEIATHLTRWADKGWRLHTVISRSCDDFIVFIFERERAEA